MPAFDDYITVPAGFNFAFNEGIYSVMEMSFKKRLDAFISQHAAMQANEKYPFIPLQLVPDFPNIDYPPFKNEIRERQQDIILLKKHLPLAQMGYASALELGGWNGWLPLLLSGCGIRTVSVGIFADVHNGLGCRNLHKNAPWLSVQADIENLSIYKRTFDLIVFEHNLSFQHEPVKLLERYETLLNSGGFLIVLGVHVVGNAQKKACEVERFRSGCKNKYGFNIDFYNSPGFFDRKFHDVLLQRNYHFVPYFFTLKNWVFKKLSGNKSGIFIYQKTG